MAVNADGTRRVHREGNSILIEDSRGELVQRIERLPDGNWFQYIADAAFLPDGTLGLLHRPSPTTRHSYTMRDREGCELLVYSADGEPLRRTPIGRAGSHLEVSERWLVLPGYADLLLYDRVAARSFRVDLGLETAERALLGLSADRRQLLGFDAKERVVHRWAIP